MCDNEENGIVYYIDVTLLKKAREAALRVEAESLDAQIAEANRGLSIIKATEEALSNIQDVLDEMRKIAVEAAGNRSADLSVLNNRLNELKIRIDSIVKSATVLGVSFPDGNIREINKIMDSIRKILNN